METNTACNTGVIYGIENGVEEFITPLLGTSAGLPFNGAIRPGVMVLRKEGITEEDRKTFKIMSEAGAKWDDIDKVLGAVASPEHLRGKSKLVPLNVDYFTVNKRDCLNSDNAGLVMEKYADPDGKLRSIPVWFPINEWWELIPHSLTCFGKTQGIKHKSSFMPLRDASGRITELKRICETPEQVEKGKRIFGGRSWQQKGCYPEECEEYQKGDCKLRGRIQFMIPGISGVGMWVIPTSSFYSLAAIKDTLERVYRVTNGRIANIIYKGNTIFTLRKRLASVPSIDYATGEPRMRKQYLITLDLNIDLFDLAKMYETTKILARGRGAANILGEGAKVVDITGKVRPAQETGEPSGNAAGQKEGEGAPPLENQDPPLRIPTESPEKENMKEPREESIGSQHQNRVDKNSPHPDQIKAIRKLCTKFQIPGTFTDGVIGKLGTSDEAGTVIKELNRGDFSRFLPKEG